MGLDRPAVDQPALSGPSATIYFRTASQKILLIGCGFPMRQESAYYRKRCPGPRQLRPRYARDAEGPDFF
jgi:hypothetical protein